MNIGKVQEKHKPMRTCIVTRQKRTKNDLLRIVRDNQGNISVDIKGKISGRGANITPSMEVFDEAIKKGVLKKALRLEKSLTQEQIQALRDEFAKAIEEKIFRPDNKNIAIRIKRQDLEKVVNGD